MFLSGLVHVDIQNSKVAILESRFDRNIGNHQHDDKHHWKLSVRPLIYFFLASKKAMFGMYSTLLGSLRNQSERGLSSSLSTFTEDFSEYGIATAVTLSYLAFYTAYDKSKKTLVLKNLSDLVTCSRGVDWTLVECNKALSLAGMTTMLMSFLPSFEKKSKGLLWISMVMLWTHSTYSMYKFYGYKLSKIMSDKAIKQLSIGFGVAGQVALSAGYYGLISPAALVYAASALSISHFWTMEVCMLNYLVRFVPNFAGTEFSSELNFLRCC